jgi:hypothetical protein
MEHNFKSLSKEILLKEDPSRPALPQKHRSCFRSSPAAYRKSVISLRLPGSDLWTRGEPLSYLSLTVDSSRVDAEPFEQHT